LTIVVKKVKGIEHLWFSYFDNNKHKLVSFDCGPKDDPDSIEKAIELKHEYLQNNYNRSASEQKSWDKELKQLVRIQRTSTLAALEVLRNAAIHEPRVHYKSSENMAEVNDNSVQLVVTSPPYNVGKDYIQYDDSKSMNEYLDFLDTVWIQCKRVLCKGGRIAVNVADTWRQPYVPLHAHVTERILALGFKMRGIIYWNKGASVGISTAWGSWKSPSNPTIRDVGEYILIFSKDSFKLESPNRTVTMTPGEFTDYTKSVWTFPATNGAKDGHPAPFPDELPKRLINFYTYLGDTVLDPFLGSGTTCRVAKAWGRQSIGYEIDKSYRREIEKKISRTAELAIPIETFMTYEKVQNIEEAYSQILSK
jgi:site-specific DNA-methyltransferase (adenine-specific)